MVQADPFNELAGYEIELARNFQTQGDTETEEDEVVVVPDPSFEFCDKPLKCGHTCKGVKDESMCLPCIKEECQ